MPTVKLKAGQRRSQNERDFERGLIKRGITYEYEPETHTLMPSVPGTLGPVRPITYTPDYKLTYRGLTIWIEVKGYARDKDLIKLKIADWFYTKRKEPLLVCGTFGTVGRQTRNMYMYKRKGTVNRIDKLIKVGRSSKDKLPPAFWDEFDSVLDNFIKRVIKK